MTDEEIIQSQDFSHPYTTDVNHILELYFAAITINAQRILELGSYKAISTLALALAARVTGGLVVAVDLCDEISNEYREKYLVEHSINHRVFLYESPANDWLLKKEKVYDFIFHDAAHGDSIRHELYFAWMRVASGGALAIHDFEQQSDPDGFIKAIQPKNYTKTKDQRGRELAIFYK